MIKFSSYIPLNLKSKIAEVICHPAIGNIISLIFKNRIPFQGFIIDTNSVFVTSSIKASILWGIYESAEIRFINQYLRRDLDVVELGGSLGVTACNIRKIINHSAKLVCVEANPNLVDKIQLNLNLNCQNSNFVIVNKAIDYKGQNTVSLELGNNNTVAKVVNNRAIDNKVHQVAAVSLSDLLDEYEIDEYVLVCDIEGAELGIIRHDAVGLSRCRQIIIELHEDSANNERSNIEEMLKTLIDVCAFKLRDRYGRVCVLEK